MAWEPLLAVGRPDFIFTFPCAGCVIRHLMHSHRYLVSVESDFFNCGIP